jgi:hypothetical protein
MGEPVGRLFQHSARVNGAMFLQESFVAAATIDCSGSRTAVRLAQRLMAAAPSPADAAGGAGADGGPRSSVGEFCTGSQPPGHQGAHTSQCQLSASCRGKTDGHHHACADQVWRCISHPRLWLCLMSTMVRCRTCPTGQRRAPGRASTGLFRSQAARAEPAQNSEMNHHDRLQRRPAPPVHDRAHDAAESLLSGDP